MRYTINDPPPTSTSGTLIASSSGTVRLTPSPAGTTLRAIAFKAGMNDSEVNSGTYYYESGNMPQPPDEGGSGQPTYDDNGNLQTYKGWIYTYDAQNRLTAADNNPTGTHVHYYYDGLNRRIGASDSSGNVTVNVWDGWNLIEERTSGNGLTYSYIQGATTDEMVRRTGGSTTLWYYQDGRGNTSHLADDSGTFRERYTYDHAGNTRILSTNNTQLSTSAFNNRFLFQGRDYSAELGLYDYRNRIYFPGWGRFLQPDPIGFAGDPSNLYRYCGNGNGRDPSGLVTHGPGPGGKPPIPWVSINGTTANTVVNTTSLPPPAAAPFGPSAGIQFSGGTTPGSAHGTFFQGYVDSETGNYVDTLPGPPNIVRAPPLGGAYYSPGVFPVGYSPGAAHFIGPSGVPWNPLGELIDLIHILGAPAGGLAIAAHAVAPWAHDHLSIDLNVNFPQAGGTLGVDSTGVYGNGGPGPGEVGEATLTVNVNFGNTPSGLVISGSGALGLGVAGRMGFGWSSGGGFFFNAGAGVGLALYGGVTVGPGGYIYKYGGH